MASVEWTPRARNDFDGLRLFIGRDSERSASLFAARVLEAVGRLETFPRSGRVIPEFGVAEWRELIVRSYRIMYEVQGERVRIAAIHHAARRIHDFPS